MPKLNLPEEKTFTGPAIVWKRIAAFAVDILIINFVLLFPFRSALQEAIPETSSFSETFRMLEQSSSLTSTLTVIGVMAGVLALLYFYMLEKRIGQTPGKMMFNIKVVSEHGSSWPFFVRSLFLLPVFPFILLIFIDPVVMLFNKEGQRLSEILGKTRVIEEFRMV
ncbi:RDD family protein [Candidatus Woesearchaeota archaeon]|nr:RDD family protein [Candidatus Woesearchaeota archaeon]